jgi:hypothetical protein
MSFFHTLGPLYSNFILDLSYGTLRTKLFYLLVLDIIIIQSVDVISEIIGNLKHLRGTWASVLQMMLYGMALLTPKKCNTIDRSTSINCANHSPYFAIYYRYTY